MEILAPPAGAVPGDVIEFEGFPRFAALAAQLLVMRAAGNADAELNPKKKIFETVQPDLLTDGNRVATYKGVPWSIKAGR